MRPRLRRPSSREAPEREQTRLLVLSRGPTLRETLRLPGILQRTARPRVVGRQHTVRRYRRRNCQARRARRCSLGIPLPRFGPAPNSGLTANSRRTGSRAGGHRRLPRLSRQELSATFAAALGCCVPPMFWSDLALVVPVHSCAFALHPSALMTHSR